MDDYAGRVLADRYRLPLPLSDEYELTETRAFDTYSGQEVLVRQVPLPEVVEAEVLDADGLPDGFTARDGGTRRPPAAKSATRRPADPAVRRAVEAAQAAARVPDHPRLDQVFDVFAEGGSLWLVSELVSARPLAALLAEKPLTPYRAAEVASDVLMALRVLHAHGWVHRNITARTVLVCDDGRVMLTGLAVGAAEEALCGYDPVPDQEDFLQHEQGRTAGAGAGDPAGGAIGPEAARRAAIQARAAGGTGTSGVPARRSPDDGGDIRAARAGAIAAYRAGARAAAAGSPPGRIADPYGVRPDPWHGAAPRTTPELDADGMLPAPALPPDSGRTSGFRTTPLPGPAAPAPDPVGVARPPAGWDEPAATARRGPATALAAERARQVRMTVVGPVTERWAPEQAGPVHENWQLAAPIGPATDLWALGALLFRAVQGHAPYPEESTAELVQLVCAEPPAFAEECGPLRPVVESLLRQDPTERPEFEELRGWLRSLVRSAPEPEAGAHVVAAPPADPRRLPMVRRRGELVRRRRAAPPEPGTHGRHKRARQDDAGSSPRSLGRTLLLLVLLLLAGAIAYAMLFMPKSGSDGAAGSDRTGAAGSASRAPGTGMSGTGDEPASGTPKPRASTSPSGSSPATGTQNASDPAVADGFVLREDPDGFRIAVAEGWHRTPRNGLGQVVYGHGDYELIVVPGRDRASKYGSDPMGYQQEKESELEPFRATSWVTSTGLKTIEVGGRTMAEGQFTWTDDQGRQLYVRNLAILIDGRYHVVQVRGPEAQRDEVTRLYEQASATYAYPG